MTITTRFDQDEIVWVMDLNKPMTRLIRYITWSSDRGIVYHMKMTDNNNLRDSFKESECFLSKEELLQSL